MQVMSISLYAETFLEIKLNLNLTITFLMRSTSLKIDFSGKSNALSNISFC